MKAELIGKNNKGSSTLELLIAFAVITLTLSAVVMLVFSNQTIAVDTQTNSEALSMAQKLLEDARATSRFDFNLVNPTTATEMSGPLSYTKKLEVKQIDLFTKQATSTITWYEGGRNQTISLSTLLTNPQAVNNPTPCNSVLSNPNGWKNPQHYDKPTTEIVNDAIGNNSNGLGIGGISIYNQKLYIAVNNPPNNGDNLWVNSIPNDPTQWTSYHGYIGSVDTQQDGKKGGGLNAIAVAPINGKIYAFVANSYKVATKGQLQVIDVTNPISTPGWSPTIQYIKLGISNLGNSIFYKDKYIYLGLTGISGGGPEFQIFDVSNPLTPVFKGSYSTGVHDVNSIYVRGDYAYIATPDNGSHPNETMTIIDVKVGSPTFGQRVGGWADNTYPPTVTNNHGESLSVVGNTVYLGRTLGTNEFYILNTSNPGLISVIGSQDLVNGSQTSVYGIGVKDYLAFLFTKGQFQVWDTRNMKPWTSSGSVTEFADSNHDLSFYGGTATAGFYCLGDYFYAATTPSNNKNTISVITPGP